MQLHATSRNFTQPHATSRNFTQLHATSRIFTQLHSHALTRTHAHSRALTSTHAHSRRLTHTHVHSRTLTCINTHITIVSDLISEQVQTCLVDMFRLVQWAMAAAALAAEFPVCKVPWDRGLKSNEKYVYLASLISVISYKRDKLSVW